MKLYDFSLQNMWQLQEMQGTEQAQLLKNYIFLHLFAQLRLA
jgi:hypothetical protein